LYNVASCWLYLKEYFNDAQSHEHQIQITELMFCKVTDETSNFSHPGLKIVRLQIVSAPN